MTISKKQAAFVEHYLRLWNASEAARLAGYAKNSARQQGCRLLTNADIQTAITARLDELKMQADEVLTRLTDHARGSMADFLTIPDKGEAKLDLRAAARNGKLHLIKKYKRTTGENGTTIEFELYDAQAALVHLGKHHRLFTDKTDVTSGGEAIQVNIVGVDGRALSHDPEH